MGGRGGIEWGQGWYGVGAGWYGVGAGVVCSGSRGGI